MTWNELHFTGDAAEIENIVIEPQTTSQVLIMCSSCVHHVFILHSSCTHHVFIRCSSCVHNVLIMYSSCVHQVFIMYGSRGDAGVLFQVRHMTHLIAEIICV